MLGRKKKNKHLEQKTELEDDHNHSMTYMSSFSFTDLLDERDKLKKIIEDFEFHGDAWRTMAVEASVRYNAVKTEINKRFPAR